MLHRIQRFDPIGVGARDLGECLRLQLQALPADTPGRDTRADDRGRPAANSCRSSASTASARCSAAPRPRPTTAVQLLRTLDPRPGAQHRRPCLPTATSAPIAWCGASTACGRWHWPAARCPRVTIQRDYEQMIRARQQLRRRLPARPPAGGALAAEEPGGARRHPAAGGALPGAGAGGVPGIRRAGVAPADPARAWPRSWACTNPRCRARSPASTCARRAAPCALRDFFASGIDTDDGGERVQHRDPGPHPPAGRRARTRASPCRMHGLPIR